MTFRELGKLILLFAGCLFFQVIMQNWILLSYENDKLLLYLFLLIARPIASIVIGIRALRLYFESDGEVPNDVAAILFVILFGYLMLVMPILSDICLLILAC